MNDYEMMNQRVDQLREGLGRLNHKQTVLDSLKADVMEELLDTRRQITRADKLRPSRLSGCVNLGKMFRI